MKNIEYWFLDNKLVKVSLFLGCVIWVLNDYNLMLGMYVMFRLIDWLNEWMLVEEEWFIIVIIVLIFVMLKFDYYFKGFLY